MLNHALRGFAGNDTSLQLAIADFGATPYYKATAGVMTNKFGHRIVRLVVKFCFWGPCQVINSPIAAPVMPEGSCGSFSGIGDVMTWCETLCRPKRLLVRLSR